MFVCSMIRTNILQWILRLSCWKFKPIRPQHPGFNSLRLLSFISDFCIFVDMYWVRTMRDSRHHHSSPMLKKCFLVFKIFALISSQDIVAQNLYVQYRDRDV